NGHNIGLGARLKPDSVTNFLANVNYTIGLQNENRFSGISSVNNQLGMLSNGNIGQINQSNTYYYHHQLSLTRLSKTKKGRRFTINQSLDINNRFNDYITNSSTLYHYPVNSDSLLFQLRSERIPRTDASTNFNYSEPLSKKFTLRLGGRYDYSKLNNGITTFNKPDSISKDYTIYNPSQSSSFSREFNRFYLNGGLEFKYKKLTLTPAIRTLWQYVNNNLASLPAPLKESRFDVLPGFGLVYKQLNFNYNRDIVLPSYNYLIPVSDNTNPYYISEGNPNLAPSQRDNLSVNYYFNNPKKSLNISLYVNGAFIKNDIVQSTTLNDQGVQTTIPVNVNGSKNFYVYNNINRQYKNKQNFIFSWGLNTNFNYTRNRLLYNGESSWQSTFSYSTGPSIGLNWNDKFEWTTNYNFGYNFTQYTSAAFSKLEAIAHYWDNELILRYPKHVIWETQFNYNYNQNVPAGYPKDIYRWNAAVNFTMLRDETGVLKISVFDILNSNKSINMYVNRNVTTTSQANVLAQYIMATFTYNIRPYGSSKKKVGGRDRMFLF
ncbi:MAG TPA: TonB-dependent receptor, partial [Chitinophagaceae bacterium]